MGEDRNLREEIRNIIAQLLDEYNIVHNIGEIKGHLERVERYHWNDRYPCVGTGTKNPKILQVIDKPEKSEGGG